MAPEVLILIAALAFYIGLGHKIDYEGRIVNGDPISSAEYPWMVSLRYIAEVEVEGTNYTVTSPHFCGASLIEVSPPIVMTAAHCLDSFGFQEGGRITESPFANSTTITIGLDVNRTRQQRAWTLADFSIDHAYDTLYVSDWTNTIYVHPEWNKTAIQKGYDIALFVIDDNQNISVVSEDELPSLQMQLDPYELCCEDEEDLTAIGYGNNATNGTSTRQLEMTTLKYLVPQDCATLVYVLSGEDNSTSLSEILQLIEFQLLCVKGDNTNICQGDSGGPLFTMNQGYPDIKGVTSFTAGGCNNGSFAGFTPVGRYYNWIQKTIDYAADGITWSPTSDPTKEPTAYTSDPTEQPTANPSATPTASPGDTNTSGYSQYPFHYVMAVIISFVYTSFFM